MVSNENIEIVNNYTYLGVKFSANGNFTNHKENLTEKTKRSFFAARRYLHFLKLLIHIISMAVPFFSTGCAFKVDTIKFIFKKVVFA